MNWKWARILLVLGYSSVLQGAVYDADGDIGETPAEEKQMVLRLIGPKGQPIEGANVGTGLNIFEDSQGHPPQRITMWLRGQKRSWPFHSDSEGRVALKGDDMEFRNFYAEYAAGGLVGYRRLQDGSASRRVIVRMEPACHVHGQLTSHRFERLGYPLARTIAFLYDSRDRLMMYFVSERGRYEFLLPSGRYRLECVGEGPDGVETERLRIPLSIEKGQPTLDLGVMDLAATRLAELYGKIAPDLVNITHWRGEQTPRLSLLEGQVVVLVFWGGWSRPCLQTMPKLIELHDVYADQGLKIIAIHDNSVNSAAELENEIGEARQLYWGRRDLPFPVGIDSGQKRGAVHETYGVGEWPTTVVIDRHGKVAGKLSPWGELQQALPKLLSESRSAGRAHEDRPVGRQSSVTDGLPG